MEKNQNGTLLGTTSKAPHGYGYCPVCLHPNIHRDSDRLLTNHHNLKTGTPCEGSRRAPGPEIAQPNRTIQELAAEACRVQDACNLSGVVHSFAKALADLRVHTRGNDELHNHPITRAWADKIASLTGLQGSAGQTEAINAHGACTALATGKAARS